MGRSLASVIKSANDSLLVQGDLQAIKEFFASDYIVHLTDREMDGGHDVVRKFVRLYRRAFSDIRVQIEILVKDKDRIAWQRTIHATHSGKFKSFPSTGRSIAWRDMVTSRFQSGIIVEEWVITDLAERLLLSRKF